MIVDDVEYPSGNRSVREVAEHAGGAVAAALFPNRDVILIRQHRYPFDKFIWELPAGKLDENEDPLDCARRELEEETGYSAKEWRKLTAIYTSPGFCSEVLHLYLASDPFPAPGGRRPEEGEETMTVSIIPLEETLAMIDRGEIVDAKTICGLFLAKRVLDSEGH